MRARLTRAEAAAIAFAQRWGTTLLRVAFGIVFLWFGIAKYLGTSPAEELIGGTVPFVPDEVFVPLLGVLQIVIGICFLVPRLLKVGLLLFFLHLPGTLAPLLLTPAMTFDRGPLDPTIEGQFVVKNLILGTAALVLVAHLRPGRPGLERDDTRSSDSAPG